MRNAACLIALAAGLVLVALWLQPAASGQARPELAEKFTPGLRRTATIARKYTQTIETLAETEAVARQTQTITTSALVHEWYPTLDPQGRPARIVRTYRDLNRTLTTEDWAKGTEAVTAASDATPPWAGQVMTLEIVDGELRVTGGATAMNDYARASVAGDFETDLQPHRAKEVGKGWKIRGSGIEPLRDTSEAADYEDGLVTITLKSLDAVKATFEFSGTLKFRQKRADPDNPGQDVTNLLHESDLKGSAEFDVAAGRWLSRELTVESKLSGKRDGQAVQGTATLTDKRAFTWGKIIDTAPDNGLIEDAGDSAHRVCSKGRIPPDRFVVGVASEKRSAIVEFDPSTQKVTRTLVAFAPKVQYGNIALSPDRTKLAFASTLNNELTLEAWNIFVLDLEEGKVDQITPEWVSGDGLANLKEFKETTTLTVHIGPGRTQAREGKPPLGPIAHGEIVIEGYASPVAFGGADFKHFVHLPAVPIGKVVVHVRGGADANWKDAGYPIADQWLGSIEVATKEKVGMSIQVNVVPRIRNGGYECPVWWQGRLLACATSSQSTAEPTTLRECKLPGQKSDETNWPILHGQFPIISARPDGKLVAAIGIFAEAGQQQPAAQVVFLQPRAAQPGPGVPIKTKDASLEPGVRGAWTLDGLHWVSGGLVESGGAVDRPALFSISPTDVRPNLVADWPELSGYRVAEVCNHGPDTWLLVLRHNTGADLYEYSTAAKSMRRLTSLGDVTTIANVGR